MFGGGEAHGPCPIVLRHLRKCGEGATDCHDEGEETEDEVVDGGDEAEDGWVEVESGRKTSEEAVKSEGKDEVCENSSSEKQW